MSYGARRLVELIDAGNCSDRQHEYDLICMGVIASTDEIQASIASLDSKLAETI